MIQSLTLKVCLGLLFVVVTLPFLELPINDVLREQSLRTLDALYLDSMADSASLMRLPVPNSTETVLDLAAFCAQVQDFTGGACRSVIFDGTFAYCRNPSVKSKAVLLVIDNKVFFEDK